MLQVLHSIVMTKKYEKKTFGVKIKIKLIVKAIQIRKQNIIFIQW